MKRSRWSALAGMVLALSSLDAGANGGWNEDREVVIEWNELLESVVPAAGLSPPRHYSMLHIAMFDAINSIERTHRPYRLQVRAGRGASAEVAAAQAARDVLVASFPAAQATFDAALQRRIAAVSPWQSRSAIEVGKAVAAAILSWRHDDGWTVPAEPFVLPELPGMYQPTAPNFAPPAFRQLQHTKPFALLTHTQYLPVQPPLVTSERYAQDLEEVKSLGAETSTTRTAEQTQLAQLFASVASRTVHWSLWNHVARDTARAERLSLIDTARAFVLLNVSIHDALQTSHAAKFIYGTWRPITAIQLAADDLNPLTVGDPSWKPLVTTPPYPSHPGNMACVSSSAARALGLIHGNDELSFTVTWIGTPGRPDVSRKYGGFRQLADDQANSRIYAGIHFRFDNTASQESCPRVAEYIFAKYMRPARWDR